MDEKKTLPYSTVAVDNNVNGTCGSTAATIMFLYYYDHIKKYITEKERNSYNSLTKTLISYIEPKGGGTGYSALKSGINRFLDARSKSRIADYVTDSNIITSPFAKIKSCINNKKPCIVGLESSTPKYGAHWVVGTGYTTYKWSKPDATIIVQKFIQMNDGWGNKGKYINYKYVDGTVYFK